MDNQNASSLQTFDFLLEKLDYKASPYCITERTPAEEIPLTLEMSWYEAKEKLGIDAVYFVADAPIIYFKRFEAFERAKIAELHRNVWSQSKIPLLFIVLPGEIRIYSGYESPKRNKTKQDKEPSRLENELAFSNQRPESEFWESLSIFARTAIESGSFWREYSDKKYFKRATRADQRLIANLRYVRRELIRDLTQQISSVYKELNAEQIKKRSSTYANNLIGRSIFALYLQDRGVLPVGQNGFFAQRFGVPYTNYVDLLTSHRNTYAFFKLLNERFNGDIFPVEVDEEKVIQEHNLINLRMLFTADATSGKNRQLMFFWAYNFEFIPIELISSIYEEFLHEEEYGKDGTYYTSPRLVDFVLDQVLPRNGSESSTRILDPACGSGIFLVEAYRRLVERWERVHKQKPTFTQLIDILKNSIFGVDIKREALRVAAFSLYLALLDYLEPKTIWQHVHFPSLIKEGNLVEADFFDKRVHFSETEFDLVIGNPPWESKLTQFARIYLNEHGYPVGDEQIAQAFLWHAPDFCAPNGQIALLCSSKNLLFNRSGPNITFRQIFFKKFAITKVFDFSALRRFLFEKAIAPTTAIFYHPQGPDPSAMIFYGAPKLTHLTRRFASLVIEADDLKQLPLQQVLESIDSMEAIEDEEKSENEEKVEQGKLFPEEDETFDQRSLNIWKVALWGTDYDYILLQRLNNYPSLGDVIKRNKWISKVGFNLGGPKEGKPAPWLDGKASIKPEDFTRYFLDKSKLIPLENRQLYYRRGIPEQFKAPLILFKRTQIHRQIGAAYADYDCAYSETFTCIAGSERDRNLLKAITALLNSELAQYYLFLTSASWGVEREEIKASEMRLLPVPFLDMDNNKIKHLAHLMDDLERNDRHSDKQREIEQAINNIVYESFDLSTQEIQHIQETIDYTIDFFHKPEKSPALKEGSQAEMIAMKKSYARAYINSINFYMEAVDRKIASTVYVNEKSPLLTVRFSLHMQEEELPDIQEEEPGDEMRQALASLDKLSIENIAGKMYHRRNFRIYNTAEDAIFIIKPAEQRYWTIGAALNDAEETMAEFDEASDDTEEIPAEFL